MKLEELLYKIWIAGLEQEIFLMILKYKQIGVGKIAQLMRKPRSTIYSCIDKLIKNHIVLETKTPSWSMFSAKWPKEFIHLLEKKKSTIDALINEVKQQEYLFSEYENCILSSPQFFVHYGLDALELIQSCNPVHSWYFLWDLNVFQSKLNWTMDQIISNFYEDQNYTSYSIVVDSENSRKYVQEVRKKYFDQHKFKLLSKSISKLESDTMLIDDVCIHISYKDPVTVLEVRDLVFYETQKILFEGLRQSLPEL